MYFVGEKRYIATYQFDVDLMKSKMVEEMNPDMLAYVLKRTLKLYYNSENPKKVYCKSEAFASKNAIRRVKTKKENIYRDINNLWQNPINLVGH